MMFFKKKKQPQPAQPHRAKTSPSPEGAGAKLNVSQWTVREKPARRAFPGPRGVDNLLRVAIERKAYADLTVHAKESLKAEVCGVLVGDVCEDDEGLFVHVQAVLRGNAAREGNTHVTFTQETWNSIHTVLEREHPSSHIVGWYHSHPGFGVEFSEMDLFIQRNFFPAPTQLALVTDPLGGDVAICVNTDEGVQHLKEFWVDGREHHCRVPPQAATGGAAASTGSLAEQLKALETRLGQLIQAADAQRTQFHQFLLSIFLLVAVTMMTWIGVTIYRAFCAPWEPPKIESTLPPIPVQIGDRLILLTVGVLGWAVPPDQAAMVMKAMQMPTNAPAAATTVAPATSKATPLPTPAK